jgi:dihydrofolate reductase
MGKISVFDYVSVDGFFAGPKGEIDWFKDVPREQSYDEYTRSQSQSGNTLLFGRVTYEMMKSFWPTSSARKMDPEMADVMNTSPKIVFSRKMKQVKEEPHWKNISVIHDVKKNEIKKLKEKSENDFTILGSGTLVQQLTDFGLIDSYMLAIVPVVLGKGKSLFADVKKLRLHLAEAKSFKNDIVIQLYERTK